MPQQPTTPLQGTELIAALRHADESVGLIGTDHSYMLASLAQTMRQTLQSGRPINLSGIGLFTPTFSSSKPTVTFTPSTALKAALKPLSAT